MAEPKLDLATFLADPKHQGDREFMFGVIDARLKKHAEDAAAARDANEEPHFLDRLFGAAK